MPVYNRARSINLGDLRAIAARSRRGMGDAGTCIDPTSGLPIDCTTGALMPGFTAPAAVPFASMTAAEQAAFLAAGGNPSTTSTTSAAVGAFCLSPLFPWVGNQITGGGSAPVCSPVFNVPSPWNGLLTVGIAGLLLFKVMGGRR
jgi:hypothetical protein